MRTRGYALLFCAAALVAAPSASLCAAADSGHEQIDRSFELEPGATVEVASISGNVIVETGDTRTAEVHITRTARSANGLTCAPMTVEGTGSRLVIRVNQEHGSGCRHAEREERVHLRLPASVSFQASSVSGDVTVGRIEGSLHVNSVSGNVRVDGVGDGLDVSSISGDVRISGTSGPAKIDSISGSVVVAMVESGFRGLRASSISGDVELRFAGRVDADVTIDSISGSVSTQLDDVRVTKATESSFRGTIGSGGAPISISSVSGTVRLTRA
jgi:hypothetical protein